MVVGVAGHEANRDIDIVGSNAIEDLSTVEAARVDVEEDDDHLVAVIATTIEGFVAGFGDPNMEAMVLQIRPQESAIGWIVIDHEDAAAQAAVVWAS
jgi:hypothetical protein